MPGRLALREADSGAPGYPPLIGLLVLIGISLVANVILFLSLIHCGRENDQRSKDIDLVWGFLDDHLIPQVNVCGENLDVAFKEIVDLKARDEFFHGEEYEGFDGPGSPISH